MKEQTKSPANTAAALVDRIARVITHPGVFHADDVCATAYLRLFGYTGVVERRIPTAAELDDPNVLVVDIGHRHEPALLNFDHHQFGKKDWEAGVGVRWDTGVPFAAFGLLVDYVGHHDESVNSRLITRLVEPVDAADTGWGEVTGTRPTVSFSRVISGFNPLPGATAAERAAAFEAAIEVAKQVITNVVTAAEAASAARTLVLGAQTTLGGRVLLLEQFAPWEDHFRDRPDQDKLVYVVYPSERGGFCIQQIPVEPGSFKGRLPLPEAWVTPRPRRGKELAELLGLASYGDATFCHGGRFIGGAETLPDTLKMAELALTGLTEE